MLYAEKSRSKASKKSKTVRKLIVPGQEAVIVDLKAEIPKVRYLKRQSFFRDSNLGFFDQSPRQIIPELRLKGNWLEAAGFSPNGYVSVTSFKGLLIIRVCER